MTGNTYRNARKKCEYFNSANCARCLAGTLSSGRSRQVAVGCKWSLAQVALYKIILITYVVCNTTDVMWHK